MSVSIELILVSFHLAYVVGICRILKLEYITILISTLKDCFLLRKSVKKLSKLQTEGKKLQKVNSLKSSMYINQARSEYISEKQRTTQFTVYQFSISAI